MATHDPTDDTDDEHEQTTADTASTTGADNSPENQESEDSWKKRLKIHREYSYDTPNESLRNFPSANTSAPTPDDLDQLLDATATHLGSNYARTDTPRLTFTDLTQANGVITPGMPEHWLRHRPSGLVMVTYNHHAFDHDQSDRRPAVDGDPVFEYVENTKPAADNRSAQVPSDLRMPRADGTQWIDPGTEYVFVTTANLFHKQAAYVVPADTYRAWKGYPAQFRLDRND